MNKLLSILNIEFLIRDNSFKNWRMILFLSVLALIMIASGHSADSKIFLIAELNTEIKTLKSDYIESKKQLLILKKETNIIRVLAKKGVGPAKTPPIKIIIVDDLIATGGTADAGAQLVKKSGGKVAGFIFVINLFDLGGAEKLKNKGYNIQSLMEFPGH